MSDSDDDLVYGGSRNNRKLYLIGGGFACVVFLAVLYPLVSIRVVPAANVGVATTLGKVGDQTYTAGIHVVNPFAGMTNFPTRTVLVEEPNNVPTSEGLQVALEICLLYHLTPEKAHEIYLGLGPEYETSFIKPQLASVVRGVSGSVPAEALYNSTRERIQEDMKLQMVAIMEPKGIIVENVLLKDIVLPQLLKDAIEQKTAAEQESERMEYVLAKETQEAERKKIEASGIKQFQDIVSQGISKELLQWKGIEATEKLSAGKNSKLVMMGNSQASLPVLMSNGQ